MFVTAGWWVFPSIASMVLNARYLAAPTFCPLCRDSRKLALVEYAATVGASWQGEYHMKKLSLIVAAAIALLSIAGCAQYIGKGKAPPPVVTKG